MADVKIEDHCRVGEPDPLDLKIAGFKFKWCEKNKLADVGLAIRLGALVVADYKSLKSIKANHEFNPLQQ